jgi:hypothetical protein
VAQASPQLLKLVRLAGVFFAAFAVAAFVAGMIVDEVRPDYSEGWGLLLVLVAFLAAPVAVACGAVIAIRVHHVHRTRIGLIVLVLLSGALFAWLVQALFFH